jgi:hypothetical protein
VRATLVQLFHRSLSALAVLTHTLTHKPRKQPKPGTTEVGAGLHCPSWARTRTLLIQRGRCTRLSSSKLLTFTRFVSLNAGVRRIHAGLCHASPAHVSEFAWLASSVPAAGRVASQWLPAHTSWIILAERPTA